MIKFGAKTQIILSDDLKSDLWSLIQEEGSRNAAVFIDSNVAAHGQVRETIKYIKSKIKLLTYSIIVKEPTTDIINEYSVPLRKEKVDLCIGIGGGSVIDLAKAVSVMAVNAGNVEDYHGTTKGFRSGIKKIMVPTTAGTGSEVTSGAVLLNKATKFKRAISGKYVVPDYAILNPFLTLSMPESIIASTGMDAIGHAVESYTSKNSNIITKMYSKQAFNLSFNSLEKIFDDRRNIELRRKMLLGSCLAGYAIYNSNSGACHSMAYPLGVYIGVPHGVAVAKLLPEVVGINIKKGCYLYADLYDLIEDAKQSPNSKKKSELFLRHLQDYFPLRYIEKNFVDYGLNDSNYEFLAEKGLDLVSALNNNPVKFGLIDAKAILKRMINAGQNDKHRKKP